MLSTTKGEIGGALGDQSWVAGEPGNSTFLRRVGCPVSGRMTRLALTH